MKGNNELPKYPVTCPSTTRALNNECTWKGDISECKRWSDNGWIGGVWWQTWWNCPVCGSKVAQINQNSPLNHPLQQYDKFQIPV